MLLWRRLNRVGIIAAVVWAGSAGSAGARVAATSLAVPLEPPSAAYQVVEAFPGIHFSAPVSMASPPGESNRLFVVERRGSVMMVTNLAAQPVSITFLDISDRVVNDFSELGLKGIAFHPGYATNGYFFLMYSHTSGTARLSRFQMMPGQPDQADPASEVVFLDQVNDAIYHNINDGLFGPDGYLYVGMGDEGQPGTNNPNAQVITQDLWSAVLRIDPDKRPGNLEPNPHPAIQTNAAGLALYSIPADNPFIGATQFNGVAVNPAHVRTEFYAVGFRNPWQFSFDETTGELWLGDVGDRLWEEVNVITAGFNGGWAFHEGTNAYASLVPPPGFAYDVPVWQYRHDNAIPFGGSAIIAGLVVRRGGYPDLLGKFLCGDVLSGNLWAITRAPTTTVVERIAGWPNIVQFGLDPSDDSILLLDYGEGVVRRLIVDGGSAPYPATLSETGIFADLAELTPNPGVVPYDVNLPFWSDFAIKRRWFAITNLTDQAGFQTNGPWSTPAGMVWVKHFDLDLDRGNASTRKRIETRVLVRTTNGSYGVSYRWDAAGTEAHLAPDIGENLELAVTNAGVPATQAWRIPGRAECKVCHGQGGAHAISFTTRQLNRDGEIEGVAGNQLERLAAAGYLADLPADPRALPRHVRPDEAAYSLEARARSYLAVNCGYCHRGAAGSLFGAWDGRVHTKLADCGLVDVPAGDNGGNPDNRLLVPGHRDLSVIWNRLAATNGFARMPPLGSSELDPAGVQLVAEWIEQALPSWQSYAKWQSAQFGSTNAPEGAPEADPDGDGQDNYAEFLAYTEPTNEFSVWSGAIEASAAGVSVSHELPHRAVTVEASTNLLAWGHWLVDGNNALPAAPGQPVLLQDPATNALRFYRFRIEER